MAMIETAGDFFTKGCGRCDRFDTPDCSIHLWIDGLQDLRRICLDMGLVEVIKWGHPTYMHADRNIAMLGAFRGDFRVSFLNPSLLDDSEGVLEAQGPNSQTKGTIRFTDVGSVRAKESAIRGFLRQLMEHAERGTKPPKHPREIDMPAELAEALDADPELAEAFHGLTPGRQKSYMFNLNQAKQSATRVARILKFREKILAGKGAMDR